MDKQKVNSREPTTEPQTRRSAASAAEPGLQGLAVLYVRRAWAARVAVTAQVFSLAPSDRLLLRHRASGGPAKVADQTQGRDGRHRTLERVFRSTPA